MSELPDNDASKIHWDSHEREAIFSTWLHCISSAFHLAPKSIKLASADASFRRYFRVRDDQGASFIVMDAPPEHEDAAKFVRVQQLMQQAGVKVPEILAWAEVDGFMLLSDLGSQTALQTLEANNMNEALRDSIFAAATTSLIRWQESSAPQVLPAYDETLLRVELSRFTEWYIGVYKAYTLSKEDRVIINQTFDTLIKHNLSSPYVFVHRDFMLRNLMVDQGSIQLIEKESLGVLDFQDAVYGPITYDIASLIRDAFVSFDEAICVDVVVRYWQSAKQAGLPVPEDFGEFYQAVEWMGLQRHLKIAGLFVRLTLRDGKEKYISDVPRFIGYIRTTCLRYREFFPFMRLLDRINGYEPPVTYSFGR